MEDEIIEVLPIAYIRGTTQEKRIVIIDEAQNIDDHIFKTIITRLGPDCKMIFLGDAEQCDFKYKDTSCLTNVVNLFKDEDCAGVVEFMESDCVRHPLIPRILRILNGSPTVKEKVPIQLNS
jgi:phosphate starvation-inducible PhoH-like protein